ncbi:MAG: stage III sporulation protein AG [Oscillospiraceae bacterium]|nr:stage III sporulation protein AG [Oscillospiraceae bacterium]
MNQDNGKRFHLRETLGRYKYVLLIAALGMVLLMWPTGEEGEGTSSISSFKISGDGQDVLYELESDMEKILSKIQGVGRVEVMLTLQSGKELILASDTTLRYRGNPQNPDDYDRTSETVTVSGGGSGTDVVVTQERSPQYRGALIVCDGGDNDRVRLCVVEAVSALTGLGSDRIAVVRWGGEYTSAEIILNGEEELS